MTNNPAPYVADGGNVLLVYKSTRRHGAALRLGAAAAPHPEGPYERVRDDPIFQFGDARDRLEDPYVWREGGRFQMIMKDISGGIGGEPGAGIHATSRDGKHWTISEPPHAYALGILFADGSRPSFARVERPQLIVEDGVPTVLFVAVADGVTSSPTAKAWNQAIPLERA
jgi:hypothetical protein